MEGFNHIAMDLQEDKKVVFTAQSCRNFHQRMLISKHAFEQDVIPVNPFNLFGYFMYELVDRDLVRTANNNLIRRCDELWVYGEVSDGVLAEIKMCNAMGKPVRCFDIANLPHEVKEIPISDLVFEDGVKEHRDVLKEFA